MATLEVFNQEGKKVSEMEVGRGLIDGPVRKTLLWEAVKMQQAKRHKGTASTKTRSIVSGSTRKIYRQKGTGNARHGDIKAPIFVGGGRVWGPHPRDYSYRLPRTARRAAIKSALALKHREGKFKVLKDFSLSAIKTKQALKVFQGLGAEEALLIVDGKNPVIEKSVRNLPHHKVLRAEGINPYDLLNYDQILVTEAALKKIQEMVQ
jgi:large subunit ribosomal protein L4